MMQSNSGYEPDFPGIDDAPFGDQNETGAEKKRKDFQNTLFPNDSVTMCSGFINELRFHQKSPTDEGMYFARVGLIQGSKQNDKQDWVGDITNCDLLIGSTLKSWAKGMYPCKKNLEGIRFQFTIRNLKFMPDLYEGKPVLKSRGVLEVLTVGLCRLSVFHHS